MAAITYKCPNCGGGLLFEPETQKYKCEYCLSRFAQEDLERQVFEEGTGIEDDAGKDDAADEAAVYSCPSCGAEVVTDSTTAATFCYYCHNPVILSGRLRGEYLPDCVVPFGIDRKQAEKSFREWIGKKRYVPRAFYSSGQIEKLTGVYFPYWIFRCRIDGKLSAQGTKLRSWTAGNMRYSERKTYQVERQGQVKIDYVARNAIQRADSRLCEGVLPYSREGIKSFSMGCLSGFVAEKRDRGKEEFIPEVYQEVKDFALSRLKESAGGYTELKVSQQTADVLDARWDYGLFPVWTLTYKGPEDGKVYYFAMNGQTGKICGELPVDGGKLFGLFISVFLPVFFVLLGVGYFLPF